MPTAPYMVFNGQIVQSADARVHIDTPFCKYGVAVFEGLCGYRADDGTVNLFRLDDHLDRLVRSATLMRIPNVPNHSAMAESIRSLLSANGHRNDVHIRVLLWLDGAGDLGSAEGSGWSVATADRPLPKPGLRVAISSWLRADDRTAPPRIKAVSNYGAGRLALMQARQDGYDTALLLDRQGHISEAPTSCAFFRIGGRMVTPRTTDSILESVTRDTLLHLLATDGEAAEIRSVDRTEAYLAEEALLCGSAVEIQPIFNIDGFVIGSGAVGTRTQGLMARYADLVRGRLSAPPGWLTTV
jgi:branched-chain amino acid aminotransferase